MTRDEAFAARNDAMKRIVDLDPLAYAFIVALIFTRGILRAALHICIGFGVVSLLGVSAWWGIPMAILSAQTLGRLYEWSKRDQRVRDIVAAVEVVEKRQKVELQKKKDAAATDGLFP